MLYALQQELVSSTMVEMVSIRQREIDLLSKQARGLAFLFAVIAGVLADSMWTGYYMYYIRLVSSSTLLEGLSALTMFVSIFLPLLGLWRCMLLMAFAPFKALRGRPADLAASVDSFREELFSAVYMLVSSIISVMLTLLFFMLSSQTPTRLALLVAGTEAIGSSGWPAAIAGILSGGLCMYAIWRAADEVYDRYRLPPEEYVSGEYWSDKVGCAEASCARSEESGVGATPSTLSVAAGLFDRDASRELL